MANHLSAVKRARQTATRTTVSAIASQGSFTTCTVTLAPYDLFPALAMQPGQTTLLTDPDTVVVYVDSNTQMLNTNPIAAGGVVRFYGLVFNDNGTLRMDCAQVNDGVPEQAPSFTAPWPTPAHRSPIPSRSAAASSTSSYRSRPPGG